MEVSIYLKTKIHVKAVSNLCGSRSFSVSTYIDLEILQVKHSNNISILMQKVEKNNQSK